MPTTRIRDTTGGRLVEYDRLITLQERFLNLFSFGGGFGDCFRRNPGIDVLIEDDLSHPTDIELGWRGADQCDGNAAVTLRDDLFIGKDRAVGCKYPHRPIRCFGLDHPVKDDYLTDDRISCPAFYHCILSHDEVPYSLDTDYIFLFSKFNCTLVQVFKKCPIKNQEWSLLIVNSV